MEILHFILVCFMLLSSLYVLTASNPVHSVLALIFTFCNAAIILCLFNIEFLSLIFIIIYVGAIAVLFLFVVMMLNIKVYKKNNNIFLILTFLSILSFISLYIFFNESFSNWSVIEFNYHLFFDSLVNINIIGQILYNYYLICFLIAGIILLISIVGPVVLTLNFNNPNKNTSVLRQLSRSDNFITFFN